ncbi:uncharacterized protein LOC110977844 [Acanthaster planci]|uniref:Uncharacterized protein LOC110977844 n=1 Tax=Acanthaster planci TaxID=133434 RepID=A0A8B7Y645_ACAPL|nr:uncharacterized protein LOC110977844 [Acanthaster planci]
MVACDASGCKIEWFHYQCVGLTADTIPSGSWYCDVCKENDMEIELDLHAVDDGYKATAEDDIAMEASASAEVVTPDPAVSTTDTAKSASSSSTSTKIEAQGSDKKAKTAMKATNKKSCKEKEKKSKKKASSPVKRPAQRFTVEHAKTNAAEYVKAALERIQNHPIFTGTYPLAVLAMTLVTSVLQVQDSSAFTDFSVTLVTALWFVATAGDDKFLQPEAMDVVWKHFHKFKLSSIHEWKSFLESISICTDGNHIHIVYQHLLLSVITLLIKDRHATDLPVAPSNSQVSISNISKEEEQVLRYVAGYVPFALFEKFRKQLNETSSVFCSILATWRSCTTDTEQTFLEYTNKWIQAQNRGGLFNINDDVYVFFRTLENEARQFLSKGNLEEFIGKNIKRSLKEKMMSQSRVHNYWCNLTREKISGDVSKRLLDIVVNLYIKIRIKAFLKVYLNLKKAAGQASKKAEKALRKELAS